MTIFTPRGYPKPEASDLISDGWDAIADLADALDSDLDVVDTRLDVIEADLATPDPGLVDSGWIAVVGGVGFNPGPPAWTNYGGGWAPAQFRKIGSQVFLKGLVAGGPVGSTIFTLPAGYRPPETAMLCAAVAGVGVSSVGDSGHVAPDSGLPVSNVTSTVSSHSHSLSNHRHSLGHSHPSVAVAGTVGQIGVRLDVFASGAVVASGANTTAWQSLWCSFLIN
jgi:hypothetical protein